VAIAVRIILILLCGVIGYLLGFNFGGREPIWAGLGAVLGALLAGSMVLFFWIEGRTRTAGPRTIGKPASSKPRNGGDKILDTSVIIDGRIAEICQSGFIEGNLIIPKFVLRELQYIADSPDPLRRAKGRRGLDVLAQLQQNRLVSVQIDETEFPEVKEVDGKLVKMAEAQKAKIMTNDFNLNKVASLHGVPVLNLNDLANALRPIFLPGEEISIYLVKRGTGPNQGVGYLEDGTMVVVDEGASKLGRTMDVQVTSTIQTSAGRMVFAKIKPKMMQGSK
jgi:uncharacterized protein YacL